METEVDQGGGFRATAPGQATTLASEMLQYVPAELVAVDRLSLLDAVISPRDGSSTHSVLSHANDTQRCWCSRHLPTYEMRCSARMSDFERFLNGRNEPGRVRYRWGCERK